MPRSSGTQPMPARDRATADRLARSAPSRVIVPSICRCRPMTERSRLVLPAPLRPTRVTTSPGVTSMLTSVRTRASPYQAESPDTSSIRAASRPRLLTSGAPARSGAGCSVVVAVVSSLMGCSEVCRDDPLVGAHLLVRSLREHLPRLEHGDAVGERSDDVHVVVDEDDGPAFGELLDEGDGAVDVLDAHARGRLVEEQQLGVECHGDRELERALLAVGQRRGGCPGPVGEADLLEQLHGAVLERGHAGDRAPPLLAHAGRAGEGQLEVLAQGHRLEEARDLEGARDAERCDLLRGLAGDVLTVEEHGAGRRGQEAGEQVEERGLARTVWSDERVDGSLFDR